MYTWYVPQPPSVDGPEAVYYHLSSKQGHWIFLSERLCAFGPMDEADMPLPIQQYAMDIRCQQASSNMLCKTAFNYCNLNAQPEASRYQSSREARHLGLFAL